MVLILIKDHTRWANRLKVDKWPGLWELGKRQSRYGGNVQFMKKKYTVIIAIAEKNL